MVHTFRYKDWIEKAERDIKSAKILKEHEYGNDVVAFHAQQAVEKSLKAYLIFKGEGIVSDYEAEECTKIAEEVYRVVISKL